MPVLLVTEPESPISEISRTRMTYSKKSNEYHSNQRFSATIKKEKRKTESLMDDLENAFVNSEDLTNEKSKKFTQSVKFVIVEGDSSDDSKESVSESEVSGNIHSSEMKDIDPPSKPNLPLRKPAGRAAFHSSSFSA